MHEKKKTNFSSKLLIFFERLLHKLVLNSHYLSLISWDAWISEFLPENKMTRFINLSNRGAFWKTEVFLLHWAWKTKFILLSLSVASIIWFSRIFVQLISFSYLQSSRDMVSILRIYSAYYYSKWEINSIQEIKFCF